MIYLIDDTNLDNMNALYVKDEKYVGIIHLINNVHDFSKDFANISGDAECVMIHRTFGGSNIYKEEIAQLADDGDKIPLVVFSAGDVDTDFVGENYRCIVGLKKKTFYENLRYFLDNYLQNHIVDLRILAYGMNYKSIMVRKWALDIIRKTSTLNGIITEIDLGPITSDGSLEKLIKISSPAIGISYDELVNEKLIDHPLTVDEFVRRINKIVNSFCQYGKNIYTWE